MPVCCVRPSSRTRWKKRGYIGLIKPNQPDLHQALVNWIGMPDARAPDRVQTVKRHGRVERRALWMAPCGDLSPYLEQAFAWPGAQWCGWIERTRWRAGREETRCHVWIAGAAFPWTLTPDDALARLQAHWTIENRVFRVRDVTYDEDRLHGRMIGHGLSSIRNGAITLLRQLDYRYIPDAQRAIAAQPALAFALLGG
jgi:hypothetical protein